MNAPRNVAWRRCASAGVVALVWAACTGSAAATPPTSIRETCATRSQAHFPQPRRSADNVALGPLVLVGAHSTSREVVQELGGDKLFVLVDPGRTVTLAIPRSARPGAGLAFGELPAGDVRLRDTHRVVRFTACPEGFDTGSSIDGEPATLWVGFLLVGSPRCVPLRVWIDDDGAPRRTKVRMGVTRCGSPVSR